jgi:hypothetical protein
MEDVSDPTLAVRLLSITRNQDLSDWVFAVLIRSLYAVILLRVGSQQESFRRDIA